MLSGPCAVVIETRAAAGVGGAGGEEAVRACVRACDVTPESPPRLAGARLIYPPTHPIPPSHNALQQHGAQVCHQVSQGRCGHDLLTCSRPGFCSRRLI